MNKKAIYLPTNQNIIILDEFEEFYDIFLNGEYKTVPKYDVQLLHHNIETSTLTELKQNIFLHCIKKPLTDILYSFNTNRLIPEAHQYKPLFKFLKSDNNRILIADEVGLGKTIEAGMIYKEIDKREDLKISLIVVPSSLTLKWREELKIRFNENFEIYKTNQFLSFIDEVENFGDSKLINEKIIISYHTLRDDKVMQKLANSFFEVDFLIMDEAHTMRNADTSTFKSSELITSLSKHIIFLTATPIQNYLQDLFNILYLLDNDYFRDFDYFKKMLKPNPLIHKLISLIRNNHTLDTIKQTILANKNSSYPNTLQNLLNQLLQEEKLEPIKRIYYINELTKSDHLSFIINRTKKKDVGLVTPRNAVSKVVNITKFEKEYYQAVIEFIVFLYPHVPQGFITIMPERIASSSMIASLETFKNMRKNKKLLLNDIDDGEETQEDIEINKEAIKYLDKIIEKGDRIGEFDSKFIEFEKILKDIKSQNIKQLIVFSSFKKTLDYLEKKLQNMNYKTGKIHGDFSTEERFAKIKAFKNGEFDILLSSEVGSEGLDMQFCNVIINYDLPWNPMRVEQRIGRIDRIGQKFEKLHIFNLCIEGSIEDKIYNKLYSKLNIFENSIGELEPILGDLEKKLDIPNLIKLSKEEIEQKITIEELAIERKRLEIQENLQEFDKMLNDDLALQDNKKEFLNNKKINILQNESKKIFIDFLQNNKISYTELKDGTIKLSLENTKKIFNLLKANMSDKRKEPLRYQEEKDVLIKIKKSKDLKISFSTNYNDDYQTVYIFLNHPIISLITKNKKIEKLYSTVKHCSYSNIYAIIYRLELNSQKKRSFLKTVLIDENYKLIDNIDYFDFISDCKEIENFSEVDFTKAEDIAKRFIVNELKTQREKEKKEQNRIIDTKINSVKNYFAKRIEQAKRVKNKLTQIDVKRMKIAEIENLEKKRNEKIKELENAKEVAGSFEILGVAKVV